MYEKIKKKRERKTPPKSFFSETKKFFLKKNVQNFQFFYFIFIFLLFYVFSDGHVKLRKALEPEG